MLKERDKRTKEKKKKRPTKKPVTLMKAKAWYEFSKFIRRRDCLHTTGSPIHGKCYTCDRDYEFKKLQAGHFIQGRGAKILFIEDNVHAQCYSCNVMKHGDLIEYRIRMVRDFGIERVEELENMRHAVGEWDYEELEKVYEKYKRLNVNFETGYVR